jgi:hypothetical protein
MEAGVVHWNTHNDTARVANCEAGRPGRGGPLAVVGAALVSVALLSTSGVALREVSTVDGCGMASALADPVPGAFVPAMGDWVVDRVELSSLETCEGRHVETRLLTDGGEALLGSAVTVMITDGGAVAVFRPQQLRVGDVDAIEVVVVSDEQHVPPIGGSAPSSSTTSSGPPTAPTTLVPPVAAPPAGAIPVPVVLPEAITRPAPPPSLLARTGSALLAAALFGTFFIAAGVLLKGRRSAPEDRP